MNPPDPTSFAHRTERLSTGRTYHFVDQKPSDYDPETTRTILCVHGFPDCWYGWRYQIGPWVRKGYRVVVPDMLGYGDTDKPHDFNEYTTKRLSDDLAALLDAIGVQKAVIIGHDWGAYTVSRFALWHPNRLLALAMLSVPYRPPAPAYASLEDIVKQVPQYGYQLYFADPSSTKEIEDNLSHFLDLMYGRVRSSKRFVIEGNLREVLLTKDGVPSGKALLNDEELRYYKTQLQDMQGPLNYYRTTKARFDEEHVVNDSLGIRADLPVLCLGGANDSTGTPEQMESSRRFIPQLQATTFEGVGHWLMLEVRQEVTEKVLSWLNEVLSGQPTGKL
ncbi:hypothetical protein EVG20_g9527 [Dentipellis fragilis]|uniref:AB hydrolase-1 domain-containing protein n=1 Tax=Dentipellis fragilis TaxID=205917 RepID=A0A4Y9XYX7_9AGAM|nr:hypothetical protein EVG20_g9527 [Dentipellis fragilis]